MKRKIEYFEEKGISEYIEHLSNSSMDECIESWRTWQFCLDKETNYPCEIVIYGYAEKNKDTFIPNGKEILDDIFGNLYDNGYVEDYGNYGEDLIKCSNSLSESIKENTPPYYEVVKKYIVKVYENSFEIIEEGDFK